MLEKSGSLAESVYHNKFSPLAYYRYHLRNGEANKGL